MSDANDVDLGTLIKVEVLSGSIVYGKDAKTPSQRWMKGQVLEMTAIHAATAIRQRVVKQAAPTAEVSSGHDREFDKLEQAVNAKDYELAKQLASGISVPDPALDPKEPIAPVILPEGQVEEMKPEDFKPIAR